MRDAFKAFDAEAPYQAAIFLFVRRVLVSAAADKSYAGGDSSEEEESIAV